VNGKSGAVDSHVTCAVARMWIKRSEARVRAAVANASIDSSAKGTPTI